MEAYEKVAQGFYPRKLLHRRGSGMAASFSRFGLVNALAQSPTDFRALVCIFLFGGNDANNLLIPMDTAGYANYLNLRGALASGGLALDQTTLLPITSKTAAEWRTRLSACIPTFRNCKACSTRASSLSWPTWARCRSRSRAPSIWPTVFPCLQIFFRTPTSNSSGKRWKSTASATPDGRAAWPIASNPLSTRTPCSRRSPRWRARRFFAPASKPGPTPLFPAPRRD